MKFSTVKNFSSRKKADGLILPFWESEKGAQIAADAASSLQSVLLPVIKGDFKGKKGEISIAYDPEAKEERIFLVGLGKKEKFTDDVVRLAYFKAGREARRCRAQHLNCLLPEYKEISSKKISTELLEGILFANYTFDALKSEKSKKETPPPVDHLSFVALSSKEIEELERSLLVFEGVNLTRDLINGNADTVTPQHLAGQATRLAKTHKNLTVTVFDKKKIEKEKMGLLLAVNQGSVNEPTFIILHYKGAPKSKDSTALIGKGVTYDTGGLNLKPTGSMEEMKCDMSGAAAVLGTIHAAASLGLEVNLYGVIPSTENSISATSFKPGDVYTAYNGTTVEIGNTDAEGRLILADALSYTVKNLKPTRMINFATLTGACVVALGEECAGLFSNNEALVQEICASGRNTYERTWQLPLYEEYRELLKSDIADMNNIGGRPAGAISAAMFLREFVEKTPWAHLDIAGVAHLSKPKRYYDKGGTGFGVRLMIDLLSK